MSDAVVDDMVSVALVSYWNGTSNFFAKTMKNCSYCFCIWAPIAMPNPFTAASNLISHSSSLSLKSSMASSTF